MLIVYLSLLRKRNEPEDDSYIESKPVVDIILLEYTLIKSLTELCLTVFYFYSIILHNTMGMSQLKVS